jgi:hypothetical protein
MTMTATTSDRWAIIRAEWVVYFARDRNLTADQAAAAADMAVAIVSVTGVTREREDGIVRTARNLWPA